LGSEGEELANNVFGSKGEQVEENRKNFVIRRFMIVHITKYYSRSKIKDEEVGSARETKERE
jgi:hypothetical protein